MFKKTFTLFWAAAILLSACGTLEVSMYHTSTPEPLVAASTVTSTEPPLSMDSSSETIRQKMLHSALNWRSIWLDGIYTDLTVNASGKAVREQYWIVQSCACFRFLSGPIDGKAEIFTVSDGKSKVKTNITSGATQMSAMPQEIAGQFVPAPGVMSSNPIGDQIDVWERDQQAWARNMIFSSYWGELPWGDFKPLGFEMVAGRPALQVDFAGNTVMWVDVQTGVILKQQYFGEGGGSMIGEYIVTKLQYDIPNLPDGLFSVTPSSAPDFSSAPER
jgi:hypothetical protein